MFSTIIQPRFGDTDCLGHINNTVLANWFECARNPIYRFFVPDLKTDPKSWSLILARAEYDFVDELFLRNDVEIRSWISRIGTKSFTVYQEAWQEGRRCVTGSAVLVHYDFTKRESVPLPDEKKKLLEENSLTVSGQPQPRPQQ